MNFKDKASIDLLVFENCKEDDIVTVCMYCKDLLLKDNIPANLSKEGKDYVNEKYKEYLSHGIGIDCYKKELWKE